MADNTCNCSGLLAMETRCRVPSFFDLASSLGVPPAQTTAKTLQEKTGDIVRSRPSPLSPPSILFLDLLSLSRRRWTGIRQWRSQGPSEGAAEAAACKDEDDARPDACLAWICDSELQWHQTTGRCQSRRNQEATLSDGKPTWK